MKYGFVFIVFKSIIESFWYLNLVELFKQIGKKIYYSSNQQISSQDQYVRAAVDIFICVKWAFIFLLWKYSCKNAWAECTTWYLIISNIYTYFYYHVWIKESISQQQLDEDRQKRRFINLILAFNFSNLSFAYLYDQIYRDNFDWPDKMSGFNASVLYSFSNSVAGNFEKVAPSDSLGLNISSIQFFITFLFITVLINKSIPQK